MPTAVTQLSPHWGHILSVFDALLDTLRRNYVPPFLVRKLFQQLFSFVNVQLFNQLLLRRECCSFSNGEYVKTGLAEVENWIHRAGADWVGDSWEELKYIRQVCWVPWCQCMLSVTSVYTRYVYIRQSVYTLFEAKQTSACS